MHIYLQLRKNIETVVYYVLHEQHGIICTFPAGWLLWALYNKFQKNKMFVLRAYKWLICIFTNVCI